MTIPKGIFIIVISTLASWIIAMSADLSKQELGALYNLIWPLLLGMVAIITFLMVSWISKSNRVRISTLSVCCLYIIYVGLALYLEKDYWPLVIW